MINVLYTTIGGAFQTWVEDQVQARNAKLVQDNAIEMDPEVAEAFRNATSVSRKFISFLR